MPRLLALPLVLLFLPAAADAATTVCVQVEVKSWTLEPVAEQPAPAEPEYRDPYAIDPALYLGRMVRYEVTHHPGYEAVAADCAERLVIELYPLRDGWTVFARFSKFAREEKVDHVQLDELAALAERLATALLDDTPISDTITRESVLRADSEGELRTISGQGHFVLGLGTQARVGPMPTAVEGGGTDEELRLLTPITFQLGYRGKYQAWGLDVFTRGSLGTNQTAVRRNPQGGHVDFDGGAAFGLHFLRYLDATGMTSFYWGGGAQFQLSLYSVVQPEALRGEERESLYSGGMDVDLLIGYEFMRASTVHFFVQLEAHVPTYRLDTEVDAGGLDTYLPGGLLQVGMIF